MFAFDKIIRELTTGSRPVITNLPIRADRLNEWLQTEGHTVNLHDRLRLIDTDELVQWWRYRGMGPDGWVTLPPPVDHAKNEIVPKGQPQNNSTDFRQSPGPCFYVLDEIHTSFNARAWMSTGLAAIWYLSQHRKLGDDVIMISQTPGQVDKQLRSMSQDWIHLTNLCKMKAGYLFTLPQRMLWRAYANQPTTGEPIMATGILKIHSPGWADCYDTARGNSIAGQTNADIGTKAKGIPWWVALLIPVALCLVAWKIPAAVTGGLRAVANSPAPRTLIAETLPLPPPSSLTLTPLLPPAPVPVPAQAPAAPATPPLPPITCSGWVMIGDRVTAYLSDGSSVTQEDGLTRWNRRWVEIAGIRYPIPAAYPRS